MPTPTAWDVRIVNVSDLTTVAYVPEWDGCEFADSINDFGHGSLSFDRQAPWLEDFYTANSSKYPWEGNYAVQILRAGGVAYTFIIEEVEIQYAGSRRQVVLGGRGLAACLTWGIILPAGFNEASADPDDPGVVLYMGRGFGNTHDTQAELDAGTYSVDFPKHRAYGGGAFVHLFEEADTGNAGSWANVTEAQASRNGDGVTWPLSLDSTMSRTNDANGNAWSSGTYSSLNVTWLFELSSGMNMHDTLLECCTLQDNAQWNVSPTGVISIAKSLGTDHSGTVLLTVPQSQGSTNSLRTTDTRSRLYASNGYLFVSKEDSTTNTRFGRREGFIDTDQAKGETVPEAAQQGLNEIKDELDEFTFAYTETDVTRAFIDFQVSDSVSIEYEPGVIQNRQITGLGANISNTGAAIEVVVGDIVDNAIAVLEKKNKNEQFSNLLTSRQSAKSFKDKTTKEGQLDPPSITAATVQKDGTERSVKIDFKTPGWADASGATQDAASQAQIIQHFESEAYVTSSPTTKYNAVKPIDRTTSAQDITITNLGLKDGGYTGRVRAVGTNGQYSNWATTTFTLTEATEGGPSDPYKPGQVDQANIQLFPMLNGVFVKFNDFSSSANPTLSGNRGKYEIQISNNPAGITDTITEPSSWTSGNVWTRSETGQDGVAHTAGQTGGGVKTFIVPDGSGFICTGLYSDAGMPANTEIFQSNGSSFSPARYWEAYDNSGSPILGHTQYGAGRLHYIRIRAINWDGTAGEWSNTSSSYTSHWFLLDTNNEAQVGVAIGKDTIAATHIMAGTVTAEEIKAGTITADKLDADQVITSAITMPQPSSAQSASGSSYPATEAMKFNLDNSGNMWWGDFASYTDSNHSGGADPRPLRNDVGGSSDAPDSYVANRVAGDGSLVVFGNSTSKLSYASAFGILSASNLVVTGNTLMQGNFKAGSTDNFKIDSTGQVFLGSTTTDEARIRIKPSATNYLFTGTALEFVQTETQTGSDGWLQGGTYTMSDPVSISVTGISMGSGSAGTTYIGAYDPSSTTTFGVILNSPDKPISFKASGGITIHNDASAQSTTANRLSAYGGNLYWGDGSTATQLNGGGGSGSYSFNLDANNASSTEIEDGETINFNGLNLTTVSRGANQINIDTQKTLTTHGDSGRTGTYILNPSAASTHVSFEIQRLTNGNITDHSNSYIAWGYTAFGNNFAYKTSFNTFSQELASDTHFTNKYLQDQTTTLSSAFTFNGAATFNSTSAFNSASTFSSNATFNGTTAFSSGTVAFSVQPSFASNIFASNTNLNIFNTSTSGFQVNAFGTISHGTGTHLAQYNYAAFGNWSRFSNSLFPQSTNYYTLGTSGAAWSDVHSYDFSTASDQALKTDIVDETKGVAFIKTLRPVTFKWKDTSDETGPTNPRAGVRDHHGFIAQEVETVLGDDAANDALWVNGLSPATERQTATDSDGNEIVLLEESEETYQQGLRYVEFIGPIVKAIQELAARVETLEGG